MIGLSDINHELKYLREKGDALSRKIESEKLRDSKISTRLNRVSDEIHRLKVKPAVRGNTVQQQIKNERKFKIMMDKLDRDNSIYSHRIKTNNNIRDQIDNNRALRLGAIADEKKVSDSTTALKTFIENLGTEIKALVVKKQAALNEIKEIEGTLEYDRDAFRLEKMDLMDAIESPPLGTTTASKSNKKSKNQKPSSLESASRMTWSIASKKAVIEVKTNQLQALKKKMDDLRSRSGIDDLNEFTRLYKRGEEKRQHAYTAVQAINRHADETEASIREAEADIKAMEESSFDSTKVDLELLQLQREIEDNNSTMERWERKNIEVLQQLEELGPHISSLFTFLKGDALMLSDLPALDVSSSSPTTSLKGSNSNNNNHHHSVMIRQLGVIEQQVTDLIISHKRTSSSTDETQNDYSSSKIMMTTVPPNIPSLKDFANTDLDHDLYGVEEDAVIAIRSDECIREMYTNHR